MRVDEDFERDERRRRVGPIVMLLPLLCLTLAALWLHDRGPALGPRPAPPEARSAHDVDAWGGVLELEAGARVVARVTRLHADGRRQRFDAGALLARLPTLSDGPDDMRAQTADELREPWEPWRLNLRYLPASRAEREDGAQPPGFAVTRLVVSDERGVALVTLDAPPLEPNAAADPLSVLLAPPAGRIFPGETVDVFLWGREPGRGAELLGLPDPGPGRGASTPIALTRRTWTSDGEGTLARLGRGTVVAPFDSDGGGRR